MSELVLSVGGFEELRERVRRNPENPEAWFYLGNYYFTRDSDCQEAARAFNKAIDLFSKKVTETLKSTEKTLEKYVDFKNGYYVESYKCLAKCLNLSGHRDAAVSKMKEALEIFPREPSLHENLGFLLKECGKLKEALEYFYCALKYDTEANTKRKKRVEATCRELIKEVYGNTDLPLEKLLLTDRVEELSPLLAPLSELIAKGHTPEFDVLKVLSMRINLNCNEYLAFEELSKWAEILLEVHKNPSLEMQEKGRLSLQECGLPEALAKLAIGNAILQIQGQSKTRPIIVSSTSIHFGQIPAGQGSTTTIKAYGGPGRVIINSDKIMVEPNEFGPSTTTLKVILYGRSGGHICYDNIYLKSDIENIEVTIAACWDS